MTPNFQNPHRRIAAAVTAVALLPLIAQLPALLVTLIFALAATAFSLPKPHRFLILLTLLSSLAVLLFAFNGRFGRDTAAGMLALMMALKCLETESMRDLRAVLGFSLFLPFAALLGSQEPLTVMLCVLSALSWLITLQITSTGGIVWPSASWIALVKPVLKQVALALPLAIVLFWLFPRISTPLWGLPGLSSQGAGLGDSMKPGQWIDTLVDDRIAFRVQFDSTVPEPEQRYWRGPVLWDFDGLTWRRLNIDSTEWRDLAALPETGSAGIRYQVSLEPTEKKYLPVLDWPRAAPAPYFLTRDHGVYSRDPIQKMTQYRAEANTQPSTSEQLTPEQRNRALTFPRGLNLKTQALAKQWRTEAESDRAYINRVMQWISQDFAYTLDTEQPRINAVDDFLFTDKKGFCQHFSSSFAVLMRAAGIPSRVVTGYVGGFRNPYGNYWVLYNKDAHAWNEVWLEGEGWVRFDPTAAVAPENILDTVTTSGGEEDYFGERTAFSPLFDFSDFMKSRWNDWIVGFNAARQIDLFRSMGLQEAQRWQMLLTVLAFGSLISYAVFIVAGLKRTPLMPVETQWAELMHAYLKRGNGKLTHETALDFAMRAGGDELQTLAQRYHRWRYAKIQLDAYEMASLIADLQMFTRKVRRLPKIRKH